MDEPVYTNHAEKRLQGRFISRQDVENGIHCQEWNDSYDDAKKVIHPVNGKEIEVIFRPDDTTVVVIPIYRR